MFLLSYNIILVLLALFLLNDSIISIGNQIKSSSMFYLFSPIRAVAWELSFISSKRWAKKIQIID